jgi:hypothetical protein
MHHSPICRHGIVVNYIIKYGDNCTFICMCMISVLINVYYSVQDQSMILLKRCVQTMEFHIWCKWPSSMVVIFPNKLYLPSRSMFEDKVLTYIAWYS